VHRYLSTRGDPQDDVAEASSRRVEEDSMFRTIAVATDCSPSALNACAVAEDLARHFGAKLMIIHVQEVTVGRAGTFVRPAGRTRCAVLTMPFRYSPATPVAGHPLDRTAAQGSRSR
jgi:nucleotide-binding universal stress UspA family protein